jgi:hypothetical protein
MAKQDGRFDQNDEFWFKIIKKTTTGNRKDIT